MNEYALRLAKPHCENCHKPKEIKITVTPEDLKTEEIIEQIPLSLTERMQQMFKKPEIVEKEDDGEI